MSIAENFKKKSPLATGWESLHIISPHPLYKIERTSKWLRLGKFEGVCLKAK